MIGMGIPMKLTHEQTELWKGHVMPNALSNPYEITVGGVTCKCSPFGSGSYISNRDLEALGEAAAPFKKALFALYEAEQSRELDGIKVHCLKSDK